MIKNSTYKLLYLLNFLFDGEKTKNEIIEEFKKNDLKISRSLITHYIDLYNKNGIEIKEKINSKREKVYCFNQNDFNLTFDEEEIEVISEAKKLLIAQKNYDRIKKTMRLFYKLARYIENEEQKMQFIDFGYYSTINWNLVNQLEVHCKEKNVIVLDYILPTGGNMLLTMHADELKISNWSQRLYLHGALYSSKRFSHLPVDRIYMIKNVLEKNVSFDDASNILTYIVSKKSFNSAFSDSKEEIVEEKNGKITLQRVIDDEFYIVQRLLYFCPELYYVSDEKIKKILKEKLEMLKNIYDKRIDR